MLILSASPNSSTSTFSFWSDPKAVIEHPKFKALCKSVQSVAPDLNETNIFEVIKILSFLGVPTDADIFMYLLDVVSYRMENLSLKSIVFFSFLLTKQMELPIVKSFQQSLPEVFQSQMKRQDLNCDDLSNLLSYLGYMAQQEKKMSPTSIQTIVAAILSQRDKFTTGNAMSGFWGLSSFKQLLPESKELLEYCFDTSVSSIDEINSKDLTRILSRMTWRVTEGCDVFYSEKFISRLVEKIIKENFHLTDALKVAKDLQTMVSIYWTQRNV